MKKGWGEVTRVIADWYVSGLFGGVLAGFAGNSSSMQEAPPFPAGLPRQVIRYVKLGRSLGAQLAANQAGDTE